MSIIIQWIIVGLCLAGAAVYLLYFCGLFAFLGWSRPRSGCACHACTHCPVEAEAALDGPKRAD